MNNQTIPEIVTPSDVEAELCVLASMFDYPGVRAKAIVQLKPECFYDSSYRAIFRAICALGPIDQIDGLLLKNQMAAQGDSVELVNNLLIKLSEGLTFASTAKIEPHIKTLWEHYRKRQFQELACKVVERDLPIDAALEQLDAAREAAQTEDDPWPVESLFVGNLFKSEPPAIEMLIPDCIPCGVVGVLYAEGGASKSVASLRLAIDLAVAEADTISCKWLDRFAIDKQARTLYLHLEDQEEDLQRRLWAIRDSISFCGFSTPGVDEITDRINKNLYVLRRETVFKDNSETFIDFEGNPGKKFDRLLRICEEITPRLIVVDTRTKASRADENKTDIAAAEIEAWTHLRDKTGATILLNAHTNKTARTPGVSDQGMNSLRGAGSYADNARFLIGFRSIGTDEQGERIVEITNPKNTRMKPFEKFTVKFEFPRYSLNTDKPKGKSHIERESLLEVIGTRPQWSFSDLQKEIMEKSGKSERTARGKISDLLALGKILKADNGTYSLTDKKHVETPDYIHE